MNLYSVINRFKQVSIPLSGLTIIYYNTNWMSKPAHHPALVSVYTLFRYCRRSLMTLSTSWQPPRTECSMLPSWLPLVFQRVTRPKRPLRNAVLSCCSCGRTSRWPLVRGRPVWLGPGSSTHSTEMLLRPRAESRYVHTCIVTSYRQSQFRFIPSIICTGTRFGPCKEATYL